jgi:hypothetical protein
VFNAKGYKSSKGARFSKSSFSKILRNEKYIGVYKFREYRAENAIPAIIDMDTWNRVQERLATNYKSPPGTYKAKRVYLLSGKLFCGHCGCKMNASCNAQGYNYYICIGRKEMTRDCTKKNLRSEFIEGVVARDALSLLTDERIEEIATIAASANKADVESSTDITALKGRLHETQVSLNNLLKAIESGLAPDTLIKRMAELEKDKKAIEAEIRNEERGVIFLDKEQVIFWLEQFKEGDIEDDDFKRVLIDLFVNSVTVWDEPDGFFKITIAYNLTSLKAKTYHLNKDGRSESDLESNPGS